MPAPGIPPTIVITAPTVIDPAIASHSAIGNCHQPTSSLDEQPARLDSRSISEQVLTDPAAGPTSCGHPDPTNAHELNTQSLR